MRRDRLCVPVLLALALLGSGCGRFLQAGVAVVNGVGIPESALDARLGPALEQAGDDAQARISLARDVVLQLVREELVRQEVERRDIAVTDRDIEQSLNEIRARFPSSVEFTEALRQEGLDLGGLRDRIRQRLVEQEFRLSLIADRPVTAAEVRRVYRRTKGDFEEITVRHILFSGQGGDKKALAEARGALKRIREGAKFAAVARSESDDTQTKPEGGALGTVRRGRFVPEFEKAAFALKPGVVSDPVRSGFGYHLILVDKKRVVPFKEAGAEIRERIEGERGEEAFGRWLREAVTAAEIEINPRYGAWDPKDLRIVEHSFFTPASPETDAVLPEGQGQPQVQLVPGGP